MATFDQVLAQMAAVDMPPLPAGHPLADGRFHRYGPKKKAWYRLFEYTSSRNGRRYWFGSFGQWRGNDAGTIKVESDTSGMDPAEAERLRRSQEELAAREEKKRLERARFAANRAMQQWQAGRATGESPYLKRKGIESEPKAMRFTADGTLLVPMVRYDVTDAQEKDPDYSGPRRLCGLQKISAAGEKRFNKGMAKQGAACRLGREPEDGELILLVEGVATGLSVRQAIGRSRPVYVAFDAGNLEPVARILRILHPKSPILFCADDDAYLEAQLNKRLRAEHDVSALYRLQAKPWEADGAKLPTRVHASLQEDDHGVPALVGAIEVLESIAGPGKTTPFAIVNAGRTKAYAASVAIGNSTVCWPIFAKRELDPDPDRPRLTDFNDLYVAEGLTSVEKQIADAIGMCLTGTGRTLPVNIGASEKEKPGKSSGGGKGSEDEPHWALYWSMIERFTQVYPSDEAFDAQLGRLVKVNHMRLMFGNKYVNLWLAAAKKRVVLTDQVVFDPKGVHESSTTVNLFRGITMKPAAGKCEKLLELLHYLCGENVEDANAPLASWCLRWAAYPLQNLGAKMATTVIMYGDEGTGKNLFWGAIRAIYGMHGGTVTQQQLESQFNDWLSAKLFLIANEVVTRQEMVRHVGMLKNLITEDEIWINPKHIGGRMETNHCNLVFLSNELKPMQIGTRDRRYLVIKTPDTRPESFYQEVVAELRAGGAEALYAYLLELPLEGFGPHTKPIQTEAKESVIEQGMPSAQLFWVELYSELLGLPYCPALDVDVYKAYVTWCIRNGHKMPQAMHLFVPNFMAMNGVVRAIKRVRDPDNAREIALANDDNVRQRRVFLMGVPEADPVRERDRVQQGVVKFRQALKAYLEEDRIYQKERGIGWREAAAW